MLEALWDFITGLSPGQIIAYFWPFFFIDFARYVLLDATVLTYALPKRRREKHLWERARAALFRESPLVSVIVPGKNEGRHIPELASSLTRQTYHHIEIIVVDDGSDDDTPVTCRRLLREGKIDRFVRNDVRGGKASAANTALHFSRGKYIVHLDADSHLAHDSIERILLPFYVYPDAGAVGGDVRVANSGASFATRLQAIEYFKSITVSRTVYSALGTLRIVAGAFGAFRRDVLERLKGWDVGPGLDGDVTVKIRKLGLRIVHEPHAICYTNVPTTFRKLAKQRFRWDRSIVRFRVRKHRDVYMFWDNFRLTTVMSFLDNVVFNILLNLKWWLYLLQMLIFHPHMMHYMMAVNYILYGMTNIIQLSVAFLSFGHTMRRADRWLFFYVPLMPPYMAIYLRLIRTYAQVMEYVHKVSYRDAWNPWKVSRVARQEGL